MATAKLTDKQIEDKYDSGSLKIIQERSDFLLPQVVDFIVTKRWMNIRPEYQRRLVWDKTKQSRLIESLIMNVPVPPVFLYEHDLSRYEVMDGQQRLNAIVSFYENKLKLSKLEAWPDLNGRFYRDLPERIQRGLDRRRVSATVLAAESTIETNSKDDLRRVVFERLNTGGQTLNPQEIRNCLYGGAFNDLIVELAGNKKFNEMWRIPPYEDNIHGDRISTSLQENRYFKRMLDCEIVLRFFAFSEGASKIKGSVKGMLDNCMEKYANADVHTINEMRANFTDALNLTNDVFGFDAFILRRENGDPERHSPPLYDALMVAMHRLKNSAQTLLANRAPIAASIQDAIARDVEFYALIVNRANTAESIKNRIGRVEDLISQHI